MTKTVDVSQDLFTLVEIARELKYGSRANAVDMGELVSEKNQWVVNALFNPESVSDYQLSTAVTFIRVIAGVGTWDEVEEKQT